MSTELVRYDEARRALAVAHTVDEVKSIRDKAEALKAYARQAGDIEMGNWAAEIKLRAERRAGEMLAEMEKNRGAQGSGSNQHELRSHDATAPKLSAYGLTKHESSRYQQAATVPAAVFEKLISDTKARGQELTSAAVRKVARRVRQQERHEQAVKAAPTLSEDFATLTSEQDVIECDALITDPPYGILDEPWEPSELEAFTRAWAERWNECGAHCALIFWSQRHLFAGRQWFDESLTNYELQQILIWHYPNNKSPQSRKGFKQTWEPVYFYRRRDSDFSVSVSGDTWGKGLNDFDCHVAAVPQSNFNDAERKVHPAQKPVSVFRWLINAVSQPGQTICDPFMGSGASGIASVQLGRRFHGIEIDEDFLAAARERVSAYGLLAA